MRRRASILRLVTKTNRDGVLLAVFHPPVPAELLQRCELDPRKFAAVRAVDISPPLFLLCLHILPPAKKRAWSEEHVRSMLHLISPVPPL
jgi:hypothetical protein